MTETRSFAGLSPETVLDVVRRTAWDASDLLRDYYRGEIPLNPEEEAEGPVTAADRAVNRLLLDRFQEAFGDAPFGYLSEESFKEQGRSEPFPQDYLWIIDPLDGTRDFIDHTGEYALHIALVKAQRPVFTCVVLPEAERLYWAMLGEGCWQEDRTGDRQRVTVTARTSREPLTLVASRSHRDERFRQLLERLSLQNQIYVGSVGFKIATILEGQADVYLSLSGKSAPKDWDMAAPELLLTEAGGQFTHADGSPLRYNTGDVSQWGCLIASNGSGHDALCQEASRILTEI